MYITNYQRSDYFFSEVTESRTIILPDVFVSAFWLEADRPIPFTDYQSTLRFSPVLENTRLRDNEFYTVMNLLGHLQVPTFTKPDDRFVEGDRIKLWYSPSYFWVALARPKCKICGSEKYLIQNDNEYFCKHCIKSFTGYYHDHEDEFEGI